MNKAVEVIIKNKGIIKKVAFGAVAIIGAKLLINGMASSVQEDGSIDIDYTVSEADAGSESVE